MRAPVLAVGDGALGFWRALRDARFRNATLRRASPRSRWARSREVRPRWRDERLGEVSKRTVKYERSVLLGFLRWDRREGLIPGVPEIDPIRGVPRKRRRPASRPTRSASCAGRLTRHARACRVGTSRAESVKSSLAARQPA